MFPPAGPTSLTNIIPSYPYQEYADDDNIASFFLAYNDIAQEYLNWFNTVNLPIYTGLSGSLLDWVAQGVYGISRPSLPYGLIVGVGPLNTWKLNTIKINSFATEGGIDLFETTDDIFKRIITWDFFKGDGQVFCVEWLKRRVMRFLTGTAGTAPNISQTYPVSVVSANGAFVITVTLTTAAGIPLLITQVLQSAIQAGAVALPFQWSFSLVIVNSLAPTYLTDVAGVLHVLSGASYPTSATGLAAGAVWSNSGVVTVVSGITPNPAATPLYFGVVTAGNLQILGGGNLPLSNPGVGSGQLWNNSGVVNVA